jgi:carboxyl-terminal processing protease
MNYDKKNIYAAAITALILGAVFFVGVKVGIRHESKQVSLAGGNIENATLYKPEGVDFSAFWKAWNILNEKYVPTHSSSTATDQEKVYGAIQGLASSLKDPYTVFFPPVQNEIFQGDVRGNFEGVGMEVGVQNGVLTVVSPLKNSPAANAGVKTGDKIIKINATSTQGMSEDQSISLIRGKKGTTVTLTVVRAGVKEPLEIKIVRDVIDIPAIHSELLPNGVFEIDLYNFSSVTPNLFRLALREFIESGSPRLLLDLRGNPGGYLEAAIDMASWFLPPGKVIVQENFGGKEENIIYRSKGYDVFTDKLRFVILVDGGSASASEILAGALHEQGVATLVGDKTFGKGSVQELVNITPDTSLKVTIARWLTPKGLSISDGGLTPDFPVTITKEDAAAGRDTQKEKAIEILLSR